MRYSDYLTLSVFDCLQRALFEQSQLLCASQQCQRVFSLVFPKQTEIAAKCRTTLKTTMQTSVALSFVTFLLKSVVAQLHEHIYYKHLFEELPAKTKMRIKIAYQFNTLNNPVNTFSFSFSWYLHFPSWKQEGFKFLDFGRQSVVFSACAALKILTEGIVNLLAHPLGNKPMVGTLWTLSMTHK